ncbi:MAG: DUF5063 domain-containing protein [Muribaculaceae bacterium]|nr:DUF5063 domain-containing protein [Muribaculaceae bacterium]
MNDNNSVLNTNSIAFIGLANEYCQAMRTASQTEPDEFIDKMLHLLPRLYISATDLSVNYVEDEEPLIDSALEEEGYESVRRDVAALMGEDDIYLEVFEEDMKYSETPVSASIAEGLADLYQVFFNFIYTVQDTTDEVTAMAILAIRDDFRAYWSATLCNVLRALNHLKNRL